MIILRRTTSQTVIRAYEIAGTLSGALDGNNQVFTTEYDYASGNISVLYNGQALHSSGDFIESGANEITLIYLRPDSDVILRANYEHKDSTAGGLTNEHNELKNIQGGSVDEYYHLTSAQYNDLTDVSGIMDASLQHIHDDRYYTESEVDTVSGTLQTQINNKDNYSSWSFAIDGVTKDTITSGDTLDFVGGDNITITRSAEDKITISGSGGGGIAQANIVTVGTSGADYDNFDNAIDFLRGLNGGTIILTTNMTITSKAVKDITNITIDGNKFYSGTRQINKTVNGGYWFGKNVEFKDLMFYRLFDTGANEIFRFTEDFQDVTLRQVGLVGLAMLSSPVVFNCNNKEAHIVAIFACGLGAESMNWVAFSNTETLVLHIQNRCSVYLTGTVDACWYDSSCTIEGSPAWQTPNHPIMIDKCSAMDNDSTVSGTTVKDALENLDAVVANAGYLEKSGKILRPKIADDVIEIPISTGGKIELGTLDAYSRSQVWNYLTDSIFRLGSAQADGDATNATSEGCVVYGKNLEGDPMGTSDFSYMRIKPDRIGLYNSKLAGYAGYLFRIDLSSNDCYLRDNTGVKTLQFNRLTGELVINGGITANGQKLSDKSDKSIVYTNTIILQANGANYETINHGLNEQFVQATVMFKPSAGTYQDQWINGEGALTVVYHDANNIRLYNDSAVGIAVGRAKIIIQK